MQLTQFSDYGLRVLTYLGLRKERSSIKEVSLALRLPENHMAVIIHRLSRLGYVRTMRGRGGGILLAANPADINIGSVVEQLEPNFRIAECLDRATNTCHFIPACRIRDYFADAAGAFLNVLNQHSLEDVLANRSALKRRIAQHNPNNKQKGGKR